MKRIKRLLWRIEGYFERRYFERLWDESQPVEVDVRRPMTFTVSPNNNTWTTGTAVNLIWTDHT